MSAAGGMKREACQRSPQQHREGIIQLRITLPETFEVLIRIGGIGQRGDHLDNNEPAFVVVDGPTDLLALEQKPEFVAAERELLKSLTADRKEKR